MDIYGLEKTSLLDFPGKVACTVFVPGCDFRCPYCYNSDLVLNSSRLPRITEKELFSFLEKRRDILDGVVICGGEPTLQKDLGIFLERVKGMGFLTKLDTNGSHPDVLASLLEATLLDFVSLDVKAPLDGRYCKVVKVGSSEKAVRRSIKVLVQSGIDFELRTTVVPTLHAKKDLMDLAIQISAIIPQPSSLRWCLQQFRPESCLDSSFEEITPYSRTELEGILKAVKNYMPGAELRGV